MSNTGGFGRFDKLTASKPLNRMVRGKLTASGRVVNGFILIPPLAGERIERMERIKNDTWRVKFAIYF